MKKLIAIFLLLFYVSAQLLLPKGNFAYIEQIPRLYSDFCETNNCQDVFEFIEEQFLEIGFEEPETDEPYEKENKSVPFYAPSTQLIVAMPLFQVTEFIAQQTEKTKTVFIYTLKDYWIYPGSIFHPPKV